MDIKTLTMLPDQDFLYQSNNVISRQYRWIEMLRVKMFPDSYFHLGERPADSSQYFFNSIGQLCIERKLRLKIAKCKKF